MSVEFKLPDLGEGIHEAEILAVLVSEGETITEDQPILEVETDKAVVQIPSPFGGRVEKIHCKAGDIVTVGSVMMSFSGTDAAVHPPKVEEPVAVAAAVTSESAGSPPPVRSFDEGQRSTRSGPVPATPATRRLARELRIDINLIHGSGPGGRVSKEDVRAFAEGLPCPAVDRSTTDGNRHKPAPTQALTVKPPELPDFDKFGPTERVAMRSIRRKIAQNMSLSWSRIPHVTHFDEADITSLLAYIARTEKEFAATGYRLTLTVFVLKALGQSLKKYPQFNASLDDRTGEIIYKRYYNLGVAVATEKGLIVPCIKNVNGKTMKEIAAGLQEIAVKAREGRIDLEDLQGGTFTLTNIGSIGGTSMVPMINFPEAAILGISRAKEKPVVRGGRIEIGNVLTLALSFDHRIADGAEAAYFVKHVQTCLEDPLNLLMEA